MNIDLTGKVVLVTGATRGIGKAIAEALDKAGATVAAHGNTGIEEAGSWVANARNTRLFKADLTDNAAIEKLYENVKESFGQLDVLINNAGISIDSPLEKSSDEWTADWDRTLQVNLNAPALLCKLAINDFTERESGIIINVASRAAFRGDTVDYMAYAASKGGLVALTRSIARGMGKKGITAFTLAPGFTHTDMAEQFIDQYGEEYVASDIALRELTRPEDIAPFIVFLCSGMAAHATGGTFDFNAGSYVH